MTRTRWMLLVPLGAMVMACGPDGPDGPGAGSPDADDLGLEVVSGGDSMHDGHDGDHASAPDGDAVMTVDEMHHGDDEGEQGTATSDMLVPDSDDAGTDEMVVESDEESTDGAEEQATEDENLVVEVEMVEFGFVADIEEVPLGEPVTFRFHNTGAVPHEAMFGTHHQQDEFAESAGHGDHSEEGHHGDVAAITLEPGVTGDIVLEFAEAGEIFIGCHLPGHFDAGMVASFDVA